LQCPVSCIGRPSRRMAAHEDGKVLTAATEAVLKKRQACTSGKTR